MVTTRSRSRSAEPYSRSGDAMYGNGSPESLSKRPPLTLGDVHKAPEWLRRPYIVGGYCYGGTPGHSFLATMFGLNNETLNAHTMIWTTTMSTYLYWLARQRFHADILPFTIFWLSCILHMPFSVGLHTTIGVSAEQRSLWRALDFTFIFTSSVLLAVSLAYFVCTSTVIYAAYVVLCVAMLARTLYNSMIARPIKDIPKKECAGYVAAMVACYVVPLVVAAGKEIVNQGPGQITGLVAATLVALVVGGVVYAHHYPERWAPGRFDLVGNSHQIMHVMAMLAHYTEWQILCLLAEEHLHTY